MENLFSGKKKIRLGIWGLGRGRAFIEQCKELNYEIAAGCDLNKTMCSEFSKLCPEAFTTCDEDEFLKQDLDVILVATFFFNHAKDSIKALNAGKHVISEVAAFFTPAEGAALVEAVEKSGKIYSLAENYTDHFVKKLWQEGVFGELSYAEFDYVHECRALSYSYLHGDPILPGNTAHAWRSWLNFHYYCTHSLGAAMEITGTRPVKVTAPVSNKTLPGYLPDSEMGSMKPSFVVMNNGGVIRNLVGASTSDSHKRRIWGTRAFVDLTEKTPQISLGQSGSGLKIKLTPEHNELTKLAEKAGHGGGDFWILYNFANAFYNGTPIYWDIYTACDVTLTGIMAVKSEYSGGIPVDIPDFRDKNIREKYRYDNFSQQHIDPHKIFPEQQNEKETRKFSLIMNDLDRAWSNNGVPLLISALEGVKLYPYITDKESQLAVQDQVRLLLRNLNVISDALKAAQTLAEKYPGSQAGRALLSFCESAFPEKMADPQKLRSELSEWLISADLPPYRQLRMTLDEEHIRQSTVPKIPEGFMLRPFKPGDEEQYIKLMHAAGFEQWNMEIVQKIVAGALDEGIFFIEEKNSGRIAASAMANKLRTGGEAMGAEMGWVAVDPEFRGMHLSTIACIAVAERFHKAGYSRAYLTTDDFRLPALKTYLSLGWLPEIDSPAMKERWTAACKKLGIELPEK
ncbi:MAG: GNAT family N-acetyltransferase [Lentisphaeria bacterium]|nr:GNAT family N-acetyltransferase [Lentisphaeria bacterium]